MVVWTNSSVKFDLSFSQGRDNVVERGERERHCEWEWKKRDIVRKSERDRDS